MIANRVAAVNKATREKKRLINNDILLYSTLTTAGRHFSPTKR